MGGQLKVYVCLREVGRWLGKCLCKQIKMDERKNFPICEGRL